jgi:hypothetical protein
MAAFMGSCHGNSSDDTFESSRRSVLQGQGHGKTMVLGRASCTTQRWDLRRTT